jgi:hypothetical protein
MQNAIVLNVGMLIVVAPSEYFQELQDPSVPSSKVGLIKIKSVDKLTKNFAHLSLFSITPIKFKFLMKFCIQARHLKPFRAY